MRILASVDDKSNLDHFLRSISQFVTEIFASGGTHRFLTDSGIKCTNISQLTGFETLLDGRVKTLHPAIFSGILSERDELGTSQLKEHGFPQFDMVIVNLYPFEKAAKTHDLHEMIKNIDIGGFSLLRAAAKNYEHVIILSDPQQYESVMNELIQNSRISLESRKRLALKAFARAADYDIAIYNALTMDFLGNAPARMYLRGIKGKELRYGENPDQKGYVYSDGTSLGVANAEQLQGKELSYNNILDADSAFETVLEFTEPTAVVLKHNTPCGVATSENISTALKMAIDADSESAYGSVISLNRTFDGACLDVLSRLFVEVVIAPDYTLEAMEGLKKKKNLRVLKVSMTPDENLRVRSISNGFLVQSRLKTQFGDLELKTAESATESQLADLKFAWKVVAHCRSNAIVLAKNGVTVGIGGGQTSRIEAMRVAIHRAGEKAKGSSLASDAFFPFYDNVELAASAGVTSIIQPGGSIRDEEVIAKSQELKVPMYFTGKRVFLH
ncbi:MAG: bifunctional phosphoribosylaminoimidazolecarboxamide formyltransferase/IMP cyclohydrolase [Candidatus Thermoplasmatota archaeon]|nr:bifunctional phosphoribosylaminoimidazolecarboxamide formyltransferase/IMP cyclohydrolase [Candidatus Thermoplasmatota archaeon]MDA8143041.1 bifunctional phosphoribosylaminoimidazolecarboxamide formyltransferase/IMP cyclohydrolase [Thermoplasmatales archaeon]